MSHDRPDTGGGSPAPRRRRRAVGPAGAVRGDEQPLRPDPPLDPTDRADAGDSDERLHADRPPHHDRGV